MVLAALALGAAAGWSLRSAPPGGTPGGAGSGPVAPQPPAATPEPASAPSAPPVASLRDTGLVIRHKGERQAVVQADRVEVSRDGRFARFLGVPTATLLQAGGGQLRVRADALVLDRTTGDLVARGHLEIRSMQGDILTAPEARWVAARRRLTFPNGVQMRIGPNTVRASRLVADLAMQSLELDGGVDITFHLDGPPK